ncbi:MAG: hypothetical protein GVY22_19305 [Gammaproteobacteria bacterium]|jgi:hypothetical protein|nr:hypothetical protein [Gammaproteobacteria bacterium]
MQAIELETEIDDNPEIHLKLPDGIKAGKARVVVLYEQADDQIETNQHEERKPIKLGLFEGKISKTRCQTNSGWAATREASARYARLHLAQQRPGKALEPAWSAPISMRTTSIC